MHNKLKSTFILTLLLAGISSVGCITTNAAPTPETKNVALGKKVLFAPARKTQDKGSVSLTDGKILTGEDGDLSRDPDAVKWTYPGRFNIAVDLGQLYDIDEIAIRLQNGNPTYTMNSGRSFPGWVEAFVSDDGENYTKVAEFSRWNPGEFKKFEIGQERGKAWMDRLRFKDLKTHGRWVGLRIYGTSKTASDEVYVFGSPASGKPTPNTEGKSSGFTVTHPQVYFHKPYLELANNIPLPVPIGMILPAEMASSDVHVDIDLPPGIEIAGGGIGKVEASALTPETLPGGGKRYSFAAEGVKGIKGYGNLYLQASSWKDGQEGELQYRFGDNQWQSPLLTIPVQAVHVPDAPRLKTVMTSLGWSYDIPSDWPDALQGFQKLGLNTINVMTGKGISNTAMASVEKARKAGFFISTIDSPITELVKRVRESGQGREIFDQFENGKDSNKFCISYRGKFYQDEVKRFAQATAKVKPDFVSMDIEPWGAGPVHSRKCLRCQADFKASGLSSWEEWQEFKGKEIITDLVSSAQKAVKAAGGKPLIIGSYNVSPEHVYQGGVFNFDRLYPESLNTSEGTTYSSLQPADIIFIGDKARGARAKMTQSNVMPWLTPGDAGPFPGAAFQWSLLENYANGSRGVWFWSNRVWDSESLIAYNKVIRAIAPVEDVIVKGDLVGSAAAVEGKGRISGMKLGSRMVLLAADYLEESNGAVKLQLNVPEKSTLRDLISGETVAASLEEGQQEIAIPLNGQQARLLEVVPVN